MRERNNTLVCLCCGGSMVGRRRDALWCSAACRVHGNRIIKQEAATGSPYGATSVLLGLGIIIGHAPAFKYVGHAIVTGAPTPAIVTKEKKRRMRPLSKGGGGS